MKNSIKIFVIALTILAFSGASFAQEKGTTPTTPSTPSSPGMEKKTEKPKTSRISGEVTSVDAKAGMLTVKGKDKDVNLTAESSSTKKALEKVKVGDMVKVSYTEKNGKMVASSVAKEESKKAKTDDKKSDTMKSEKK